MKAKGDMKSYNYSFDEVMAAYRLVKENRGAAGIDHQSLEQFEENLDGNIYKVFNRLASGSYFPPPVKAVAIPKKSGGKRNLGIPTVSDRVAQTVVKNRLEPLLDPAFHENSYGFRPGRSAHQALEVTRRRCWRYSYVVEFDIAKAFDNIDHERLMKALQHHGVEKSILMYIERWLKAPMQHGDGSLEERRSGTPQGGVISPLLANLFFHYVFDVWMGRTFPDLPFCRFADDGLVHCQTLQEARQVLAALSARLEECGLSIHPGKTSIVCCNLRVARRPDVRRQFVFLGYAFRGRRCQNRCTAKSFTSFSPAISLAAEKSVRQGMKKMPFVKHRSLSLQDIAKHSEPYLRGWFNYYGRFYFSRLQRVASFFNVLLLRWAMRKFKRFRKNRGKAQRWLIDVAQATPSLFLHWKHGWTRMVG